jgi:hypothetical protein
MNKTGFFLGHLFRRIFAQNKISSAKAKKNNNGWPRLFFFCARLSTSIKVITMDNNLYDEFGNYVGPELEEEDESIDEEENAYLDSLRAKDEEPSDHGDRMQIEGNFLSASRAVGMLPNFYASKKPKKLFHNFVQLLIIRCLPVL